MVYTFTFDKNSEYWENSRIYNLSFLICKQNYFNARLIFDGRVFLTDVLDDLGIKYEDVDRNICWQSKHGEFIDFNINNSRRGSVNVKLTFEPTSNGFEIDLHGGEYIHVYRA